MGVRTLQKMDEGSVEVLRAAQVSSSWDEGSGPCDGRWYGSPEIQRWHSLCVYNGGGALVQWSHSRVARGGGVWGAR